MNILDIAIAKKLAGGGGGSGADNYNDLSNLPKINDTTLSGNKSSSALGLQSEINSDSKLASDLVDDTNQDNKFVTSTEKQTWNNKQNAIDSDHKLSSSLVSFTTAEAAALASGIDSSKVGQISTNQTNILYGLNTGVKNIIDFSTGQITPSLETRGVTWTISENKGVIANGTSESTGSYPVFCKRTLPVGTYKLSGGTSRIKFQVDSTIDSGSGATLTVTSSTSQPINFAVVAIGNTTFSNETIYPMVCTEEAWNQSHDYMPPALPNYDLTRLEAEDRAALAEEIDAGAKNLLQNVGTSTTIKGVTFTVNSDGSVSTYGTSDAGDAVFYINKSFKFQSGVKYVLSGCPSGGSAVGYRLCSMGATYVNEYGNGAECVGDGATREIAIYVKNSGTNMGTAQSPKKFYPMICTKAAFGVSQKFVPFRLPNNNLGYKTYEINLSAVTISKAGSGVYWYKISVSSDFSKVVSVSLTDGKEIPNKRSFMPYIENGTGGAQAIGFLIADPDAPATMTFNNGAYMSLTAFGYLK